MSLIVKEQPNKRTFKALQTKEYQVAEITLLNRKRIPEKPSIPAFLGPDSTIYDVNYNVLNNPEAQALLKMKVFQNFPEPQGYATMSDYEEAVINWKKTAQQALKYIQLPNVLGRYFARPRVDNTTELSDPDSDKSDSIKVDHELEADAPGSKIIKRLESTDEFGDPKTEGDVDETDFWDKKWTQDRDPWEAQLVPPEPEPEFYTTYEEYEMALCHWASICSHQLAIIPPHPQQLRELLSLTTAEERLIKEKEAKESDKGTELGTIEKLSKLTTRDWAIRSGLTIVHSAQDPLYANFPPQNRKGKFLLDSTPHVSLDKLAVSKETRDRIKEVFETLFHQRMTLRKKVGSFNVPILPRLHGTFTRPFDFKVTYGEPVKGLSTKDALRRTDLTADLFNSCLDCPQTQDRKIEPSYYMYDVNSIDLTKLSPIDQQYINRLKNELRHLETHQRLDSLNSWWWPTIPKSIHEKLRKEVEGYLIPEPASEVVSADKIIKAINNGMFFDKFRDMLSAFLPCDNMLLDAGEESATYLEILLNSLKPEVMPKILSLFFDSSSPLVHAKLSLLVSQVAQSQHALPILGRLVETHDLLNLWLVTHAIAFFEEVPIDIFPYHPTTVSVIRHLVGPIVFGIIEAVFCHYYFTVISNTTSRHSFEFIAINQYVSTTRKGMADKLTIMLQENPSVISNYFFRYINFRASSVSAFFLFVVIQLMQNQDSPAIKTLLQSSSVDLLNRIRLASSSKFLHVQFAARRMFGLLQAPGWIDFLYSVYPSTPIFEQDLLSTRKGSGGVPTLLALMLHDFSLNSLHRINPSDQNRMKLVHTSPGSLFRNMLDRIQHLKGEDAYQEINELISSLLAEITATLWRLIKASPELLNDRNLVSVSPEDVLSVFKIVENITATNEASYAVKAKLLAVCISFVKIPNVFDSIKKDSAFYTRLVQFCRDGSHLEFNLNAWKMFYVIIKFHGGVLTFLEGNQKQKPLAQFLDIIGTSAGTFVIINGLRFVTKLFNLAENEQKKLAQGKLTSRGERDTKSLSKDVKLLCNFYIANHLFVKIHMIYKRIYSTNCIGAPFQELVKFYYAIATVPSCQKLLLALQKNTEYKEEIQHILEMYQDHTVAANSSTSILSSPLTPPSKK